MLKLNDRWPSDYHDEPTDVQPPPAKRVKPLFHDPGHIPAIDMVFSEYDWRQGTYGPARRNGISLPLSPPPPPSSVPGSSGCKLDKGALSAYLRKRPPEPLTSSDPWFSSSSPAYPCSPIAREDIIGSPLQESMEAYAEIDRNFRLARPFPTSSATTPTDSKHLSESYRSGKEKFSQQAISDCVGSLDSAMGPSLCSEGSRSTMCRHSLSSSPDNTTVEPSSLQSNPVVEGEDILFALDASKGKPTRLYCRYTRYADNVPPVNIDDEDAPDLYASHFNDWEREQLTDSGWNEHNWRWETLQDGHRPTAPDKNLWFPHRRPTTTRDEHEHRASSLVPSFHSHEGCPTLESGNADSDGGKTIRCATRDRLATVVSAVRLRYVAISYKVRLAVFRTEKRVEMKFGWRRKRAGVVESGGV